MTRDAVSAAELRHGPLQRVVKWCTPGKLASGRYSAIFFVDHLECGHTARADPNRDTQPTRRRCKTCRDLRTRGRQA